MRRRAKRSRVFVEASRPAPIAAACHGESRRIRIWRYSQLICSICSGSDSLNPNQSSPLTPRLRVRSRARSPHRMLV